MNLIRDLDRLPEKFRRAAVSIGNFDGVHRGHAQIVERLAALARRLGQGDSRGAIKVVDAKPLVISRYTNDQDAPKLGYAWRGVAKGYKLFALWGQREMPLAWWACRQP